MSARDHRASGERLEPKRLSQGTWGQGWHVFGKQPNTSSSKTVSSDAFSCGQADSRLLRSGLESRLRCQYKDDCGAEHGPRSGKLEAGKLWSLARLHCYCRLRMDARRGERERQSLVVAVAASIRGCSVLFWLVRSIGARRRARDVCMCVSVQKHKKKATRR